MKQKKTYFSLDYFLIKNRSYVNIPVPTSISELSFKQALKIIFEYHVNKKKILFIGFPRLNAKKYKTICEQTNHVFLPNGLWLDGLVSNSFAVRQHVLNKLNKKKGRKKTRYFKTLNLLVDIKNKVDLVVALQPQDTMSILNEMSKLNLPIIAFHSEVNKHINGLFYEVFIDFTLDSVKKLCCFLIYSILCRSYKTFKHEVPNKILKLPFWKLKGLIYRKLKYKNKFRFPRKRFNRRFKTYNKFQKRPYPAVRKYNNYFKKKNVKIHKI